MTKNRLRRKLRKKRRRIRQKQLEIKKLRTKLTISENQHDQATVNLEKAGVVTTKNLYVQAMLTQVAYQDEKHINDNFYQTTWESGDNTFFSGDNNQLNKQVSKILQLGDYTLFSNVEFIDLPNPKDYRAFKVSIKNSNDEIIHCVVIRGTHTFGNMVTDALAWHLTDGPHDLAGSKIVDSFHSSYDHNLKTPLLDKMNTFKNEKVAVLGHSLGGPYASYLAYDMLKSGYTDVSLYTFNSPRPGNKVYAEYLNNTLSMNIRHVTHPEVVSLLPPRSFAGSPYHTGKLFQTDIDFIKINNDGILLSVSSEVAPWSHTGGLGSSEGNPGVVVKNTQVLGYEDNTDENGFTIWWKYGSTNLYISHLFYTFGTVEKVKEPSDYAIKFLDFEIS